MNGTRLNEEKPVVVKVGEHAHGWTYYDYSSYTNEEKRKILSRCFYLTFKALEDDLKPEIVNQARLTTEIINELYPEAIVVESDKKAIERLVSLYCNIARYISYADCIETAPATKVKK